MLLYGQPIPFQAGNPTVIEKNGMKVSWLLVPKAIQFTMEAPTDGWVCVGINPKDQLAGSILFMAHMVNGQAEVVDHYVEGLGDYSSVVELGGESTVFDSKGDCESGICSFSFCVMRDSESSLHPELIPGQEYTFHLAYSRSPDFQHHSIMRTKVRRKL